MKPSSAMSKWKALVILPPPKNKKFTPPMKPKEIVFGALIVPEVLTPDPEEEGFELETMIISPFYGCTVAEAKIKEEELASDLNSSIHTTWEELVALEKS